MTDTAEIHDLQEDIERTREHLGHTVDALKDKMHPKPVVPIGALAAVAGIVLAVWLWRRR